MTLLAPQEGANLNESTVELKASQELQYSQEKVQRMVQSLLEKEEDLSAEREQVLKNYPEFLHPTVAQIVDQVFDITCTTDTKGGSAVSLQTPQEKLHFLKKWSTDYPLWKHSQAPSIEAIANNTEQAHTLEQLYLDRFRRTAYQVVTLEMGEEGRVYNTEESLGQGGFKQWEKAQCIVSNGSQVLVAKGSQRHSTLVQKVEKQLKRAIDSRIEAEEHYQQTKMMAEDGMLEQSELWDAEDMWEDKKSAEEELHQQLHLAKRRKERERKLFIYERDILKKIHQLSGSGKESLVQYLGESTDGKHILMQYIEGVDGSKDVADLLIDGVLTEVEVLQVLEELLAGIELLHRHGFVHLDIKPENIFVERTEQGTLKSYLGDLTPSHVEDPQYNMWNAVGSVVSTPSFVPREMMQAMKIQVGEETHFRPDRYADLYAVKMILEQLNATYITTAGVREEGYNSQYAQLYRQIRETMQQPQYNQLWGQLHSIEPRYHTPEEYDTTILERMKQALRQLRNTYHRDHE